MSSNEREAPRPWTSARPTSSARISSASRFPPSRNESVVIVEDYGYRGLEGGIPRDEERVVLTRPVWSGIADIARREFNDRLKAAKVLTGRWHTGTNLVDRLLGKELCVLAWAAETANDEQLPVICSKWAALRPEERWWLFSMTVAEAGLPEDTQRGWRRALFLALSDGEKPARRPQAPPPGRERSFHCRCSRTPNELSPSPRFPSRTPPRSSSGSCPCRSSPPRLTRSRWRAWQNAHRARQLLEGPQAAHPQQGLHPRLPAAGHGRPGTRPGDLREAHGDGRRILRRPLAAPLQTHGNSRHALHRPHRS